MDFSRWPLTWCKSSRPWRWSRLVRTHRRPAAWTSPSTSGWSETRSQYLTTTTTNGLLAQQQWSRKQFYNILHNVPLEPVKKLPKQLIKVIWVHVIIYFLFFKSSPSHLSVWSCWYAPPPARSRGQWRAWSLQPPRPSRRGHLGYAAATVTSQEAAAGWQRRWRNLDLREGDADRKPLPLNPNSNVSYCGWFYSWTDRQGEQSVVCILRNKTRTCRFHELCN